jgi:hypothetical protein
MTRWLQRQENVDRFSEFLAWTTTAPINSLHSPSLPNSHTSFQADEDSEPLEDDAVVIPEHAVSIPQAYLIAKQSPSSAWHVTASTIISRNGYNASQFVEALSTFLSTQGSFYQPHPHDIFSLCIQVVFKLPDIPEVGSRHSHNVIRARPPTIPSGSGLRLPWGFGPWTCRLCFDQNWRGKCSYGFLITGRSVFYIISMYGLNLLQDSGLARLKQISSYHCIFQSKPTSLLPILSGLHLCANLMALPGTITSPDPHGRDEGL